MMGGVHPARVRWSLPPAVRVLLPLLSSVLSSGSSELPVQHLRSSSSSSSSGDGGGGGGGGDGTITRAEVLQHQSTSSMWVVVDRSWVVNVTAFLPHHPGGLKIMGATIDANFSFKHGENAHFAATAAAFDDACAAFDAQPTPRAPLDFDFWRSRDNGGLNHDGRPVGPRPSAPVGTATILGRLKADDEALSVSLPGSSLYDVATDHRMQDRSDDAAVGRSIAAAAKGV